MPSLRTWLIRSVPCLLACGSPTEATSFSDPALGAPTPGLGDAGVPGIGPLRGAIDSAVPPPPAPVEADAGPKGPCAVQTVQTSPSVPDMLIVLDRSGSMNRGQNRPTDRWGGSVSAISDVVQRYDTDIRFGLMTFPAVGASDRCTAGTVNVGVAGGTGSTIASTLSGMNADGNTPTASTLLVAHDTLGPVETSPDLKTVPKYILLVTDGDPNCVTADNPQGAVDQAARDMTIAEIGALAKDGIQTYVVGFETAGTSFEPQLDLMAQAGATGATRHRSVSSGDDLAAALEEVVRQVTSCEFSLNEPVEDASYVAVTVDGVVRGFNRTADGWTLGTDKQTVTLTGAACDAIKNGSTLTMEVRCTVVTVN